MTTNRVADTHCTRRGPTKAELRKSRTELRARQKAHDERTPGPSRNAILVSNELIRFVENERRECKTPADLRHQAELYDLSTGNGRGLFRISYGRWPKAGEIAVSKVMVGLLEARAARWEKRVRP